MGGSGRLAVGSAPDLVVLVTSTAANIATAPPGAAERLHALFDREWQWRLEESPELATATGVHAKGWTRQQVMDFLATNTALSLHEFETETDRHISWPGQALSYEIGYLKLRQLRANAEKELGDRFDVRLFHDAVLKNGSVPLPELDQQIARFIAERKAGK